MCLFIYSLYLASSETDMVLLYSEASYRPMTYGRFITFLGQTDIAPKK